MFLEIKKNLQNVKISTVNDNMLVIRYEDVSKHQMIIYMDEIVGMNINEQMQYQNQNSLVIEGEKPVLNYSEIEIFFGEHRARIYFDLDTIPNDVESKLNIFNIYVAIRSLWVEYKKKIDRDLAGVPQF
jgi:hypothetical protein